MAKSSLKVTLNFPTNIRLQLDGVKVTRKAGNDIAKNVRDRLRTGQGADGPMPPAKLAPGEIGPVHPPLNKTGTLIRSTQFKFAQGTKERGAVFPVGKREDRMSSRKSRTLRNAMILGVQLATRPELATSDPLGVTDAIDQSMHEAVTKEAARQLKSGGAGLVAQMKEIKRVLG